MMVLALELGKIYVKNKTSNMVRFKPRNVRKLRASMERGCGLREGWAWP